MPKPLARKVMLIGWDAADWRMIDPLLQRGAMPTLQKLIDRGVRGTVATIRPMLSPMLWTSIATGKRADKHGILGFTEPMPDASGIRPVTSTSRTCKALWNIAADHGLRSCVVNWFASHPAESVPGAVVSDAYVALAQPGVKNPALPAGTVHPAAWAEPLARLLVNPAAIDGDALLPFVPRAAEIDQASDTRLITLATLLARAASVQAAACFTLQETDWDLACVYFGAIDEFGHHFMPYHPPRMEGIDPRDAEIYGSVVEACYRFHDLMLARLLEIAGDDTTVLLVSDHGFCQADDRPGTRGYEQPEQWHRPYGVGVLAGPGVMTGERLYGGTILDVTPTVLRLLGIEPAMDMDGRAWLEVLQTDEPITRVLTWERAAHEPAAERSEEHDPVAAALAMRHLADLGYVDLPTGDAQQQIDRAIEIQRYNKARALSDSRRAPRAVDLWRQLIAAHPQEHGYRFELARCLTQLKRFDEAMAELDVIADLPGAAMLVARICLERGDLDDATAKLETLLAATPGSAVAWTSLGQVLLRRGDHAGARRHLANAATLDRQNPVIADALAELAISERRYGDAVGHALEAVSLAHHFPKAHYHLGCALRGLGDTPRALLALRTSARMAPHFLPAQEALAELAPDATQASRHALTAASARLDPTPHAPPTSTGSTP